MSQTTQDMRARLQANAQSPLYDGNYANGNRPYMLASGTIGHGLPLTITANNFTFGTKTHNAPHLWETFQTGTHGDFVANYDPNWHKYNGPLSIGARISSDHARYPGSKAAFNDCANGFSTNYRNFTPGRKIYASHWAYVKTQGYDVIPAGTVGNFTISSVTVPGKNWVPSNWVQYVLAVSEGTGSGLNDDGLQPTIISSNTTDTLTFDMAENGGWWSFKTFSTGAVAGVDVPYTIVGDGEVSIDTTGAGDAYGPWTSSNGTIRIGYRIRVRSKTMGISGVVKVGSDINSPLLTVTAVTPDSTTRFKIVPQLQLKQSRYTTSATSDKSPHYNNTGSHAISSWHFQFNNQSNVELFYGVNEGNYKQVVTCPTNEWYHIEATIYLSDTNVANGSYSVTVTSASGIKSSASYQNIMNREAGSTWLIDEYLMGLMFANLVTRINVEAYTTDVYIESDTWKRIEIGNHPIYSQCTIREPQPFTNWSADSVTITQNIASISGPKYVFFVDDNNSGTLVRSLGV